ncbi:hypothetical protein FN846DRAFT_1013294 [Sphaerosporella brunnea]|uniref:Uncharacterized protein n=1 Tax=Sphaerosporella brunnea TaxID=1250544 RepID=A0A5J5EXY8_9PEZI|nr:hypothetical protein FN846DRAFT_1013294 [Sphaerosporella brunnea]
MDTVMVDAPPLPLPENPAPLSAHQDPKMDTVMVDALPLPLLENPAPSSLPDLMPRNPLSANPVEPYSSGARETEYQRLQRCRIELVDELTRAKSSWPRVKKGRNQRDIKKILLTDAISDIKRVLRANQSALRRGGQDYKRCLQIMCFMERQLDILKGKRMSGLRARAKNGNRILLAETVAFGQGRAHYTALRICQQEKQWIKDRYYVVGKQGRNVKVRGKLQDEGTLLAMREHMARVGDKLDSENLAQAIVDYWRKKELSNSSDGTLDKERQSVKKAISSRACRKWLSEKAGLKWQDSRKGLFEDGHEREDVVSYRQTVFLPTIESLQPSFIPWSAWYAAILDAEEYSAQDPVTITPTAEHDIIPVYQNECTYNANDGRHQIWCSKTNQPLRKKGRGPGIMVSDFMTPGGPLKAPHRLHEQDLSDWGVREGLRKDRYAAQVQLECGGDTWFNGEMLRAQTILAAIPLFEAAYPGCKALFVFDNATIHLSYRGDALLAQNIALNPGKGTDVRDTFDYRNNRAQKMTDTDGKSRGLREILKERGLWRSEKAYKSHRRVFAGAC